MNPFALLQDQLTALAEGAIEHTPNFVAAVAILLVTWLIAKAARRISMKLLGGSSNHRSLAIAVRKMIVIGIWIGGLGLTAVVLFPSIKPSSLVAGLGLGSVAIGFAFKDIFENFFAGMLILLRRPFRIGDFIEVEEIEGKIEDITIRDTLVRQTDGQPVIIPNSMLFKNPVTVRTDRDRRRVHIECGIAYSEDVETAQQVILNAVNSVESVMDDQPVDVLATRFGASSIDFDITWWTGSQPIDIRRSRDNVITAVKNALDKAEIEIPFPYRTLTFAESIPLESGTNHSATSDAANLDEEESSKQRGATA